MAAVILAARLPFTRIVAALDSFSKPFSKPMSF
jgi:hypothetical protein